MKLGMLALAATVLLAVGARAETPEALSTYKYKVTITNLTDKQAFSPPVLASHAKGHYFFRLGHPASTGVAYLAEDGITDQLAAELGASPKTKEVVVGNGAIMPGTSKTYELSFDSSHQRLSLATMLATTNDGFVAARNFRINLNGRKVVYLRAYDAGSEQNNEDCDYVPGPPCSAHMKRMPEGAEGVVHVHRNIKGNNDVPKEFDWKLPVAKVVIEKI